MEGTGEAEILVGAVGEAESVVARGPAEAVRVEDTVEAKDVAKAEGLIEYMEA